MQTVTKTMPTKKPGGSTTAKYKKNRNEIREMLMEQLTRAMEKRGFVQELFTMLDKIDEPDKKLRLAIELTRFILPQQAAQRVEIESTEATVEKIVFQQIAPPSHLKPVE